jgi:hypothetical protein
MGMHVTASRQLTKLRRSDNLLRTHPRTLGAHCHLCLMQNQTPDSTINVTPDGYPGAGTPGAVQAPGYLPMQGYISGPGKPGSIQMQSHGSAGSTLPQPIMPNPYHPATITRHGESGIDHDPSTGKASGMNPGKPSASRQWNQPSFHCHSTSSG